MRNIAIIPARSGSKGLKDKNIRMLNGRPLMWYSIRAAINSGCFDEIMVSTDSEEYARIAKDCGANVPFLRDKSTAADNSSSWEVVTEVLNKYKEKGAIFDNVMLLQPTSPLRDANDIEKAFETLSEKKADGIVSVCEVEHSPLWSNTLPNDNCLKNFIRQEAQQACGRQQLPAFYRINGAIYLSKINYDEMEFNLYGENCYALIMPQDRSVDVDTEMDFLFAEQLIIR